MSVAVQESVGDPSVIAAIQIDRIESQNSFTDDGIFTDCRTVAGLRENGRVVVTVQHGDIDGCVVAEWRNTSIQSLDGQVELSSSFVIKRFSQTDDAGQRIDGEMAMLVASDDGILDLGVDANVQRCGQHVQDFCTDRRALRNRCRVKFAAELRWVVVHVQHVDSGHDGRNKSRRAQINGRDGQVVGTDGFTVQTFSDRHDSAVGVDGERVLAG